MVRLNKVVDNDWILEDRNINQMNAMHLDKDGLIDTYNKLIVELKKIDYLV